MTLLARNTKDCTLRNKPIEGSATLLKPRTMAFEAPSGNRTRKVRNAVNVPRTINPLAKVREVAHWQFVQTLILPVQECLTIFSRSGDKVDRF